MEFRRLGRTDLMVSAICLGTMTFGEQNDEAQSFAILDRARAEGINFLDAAELYPIPPRPETQGRTEEIVGRWLKQRGNRDEMIVATKVVGRSRNTWFRDDGSPAELSRSQIREACHNSLRRLGVDRIDLYQVHWPDRPVSAFGSNPTVFRPVEGPEIPLEETLGALGELVAEGKVRHIGVSNETAWATMRYLRIAAERRLPRIEAIQNAYNLVNRTFEIGLAEIALREDVGLLAYSPLGQGALTGKYLDGALPAGSRKALFNRLQRYEKPGAEQAIAAYVALARAAGMAPAEMAIRFVTQQPFVTATIIGATTLGQLEADLAEATRPLDPALVERIDAIHQIRQNPCP